MTRPVLLIGGAPIIPVDAVRFLTVEASGRTASFIAEQLDRRYSLNDVTLLLSQLAVQAGGFDSTQQYRSRDDLERAVAQYIQSFPDAVIFMSAAVNDYAFDSASETRAGVETRFGNADAKISSGADELTIRLKPASKLIAALPAWGHAGSLIACKYEDRQTVVQSAQSLRRQYDAKCVVANSLCGAVQSLVFEDRVEAFTSRDELLVSLAAFINDLVRV